ncbi:carbohydrate ABC transporter permease [Amantichitinum ursilacus]|uniref:L-arabinose transport system permease protein AraP n=1 Tax=Amantichitinum ursilacus TaxID=857265 RepID=A0A0N0XN79_9NEIS|nr:sugar ABC transporter permease [Amantichitinum ursilacus]KPC54848.1 L-arabinose transport system permease protein AraP [Amantichitinum ursilacus]
MESVLSPAASSTAPRRRKRFQSWKWAPYIFISPFVIIFAIFGAFPLIFSATLSFAQWDPAAGFGAIKWIQLDNYKFVLTDRWFWKSLGNTVYIALASGLPQHLVAIPFAAFLSTLLRGRNIVLGAYFLPFITSSVAISLIFSSLFSKDFGAINAILMSLHDHLPLIGQLLPDHKVDWLQNTEMVKPTVSFVVFWRYVGWNTVLYLAAMQTIPEDLYEAATLDGASITRQFWHITLPMIRPMMFFAVSLTLINNLQLFEEPFILLGDNGGTGQAAMTTAMYMYRTAFYFSDFGTACAISWVMFVIIAVLSYGNNRLFKLAGGED